MHGWKRWQRLAAFLVTILVVLATALPALAASRSFRSSGGSFRSRSPSAGSFSRSQSRLGGSPTTQSRGSFSTPAPSFSRPGTSSGAAPGASRSAPGSPGGSFSSPSRTFRSTGQSFSSQDRSFSTGSRDFSSPVPRSFSSPARDLSRQTPGTTGTTTIAGETYTTQADRYGRPVVIYDVGRSRYPDLPPVVVIGTPPMPPWYYHDLYWGMPWYLRIWYQPVYAHYGPGESGFVYSLWAWVALAGGVTLASLLLMLWVRRRYFDV